MKKLLAFILMLLPMIMNAQDLANFILTSDGTYQTEDGKDFVVIPFEGKTAQQIYKELASNVGSTFNDPSKVMSGVENVSIKIRAFSNDLIRISMLGLGQSLGGYYQLEFRIKDGRVRVSAPIIEETLWIKEPTARKFSKEVKGYFKEGELKEKKKKDYDIVVAKINGTINRILHTSALQDEAEDW
ncbi:MAG: hypothetical protein HDS78_09275 [Bacteroidales bacterium]|nr:hypothetical protein [Bacteroidales bacterium]